MSARNESHDATILPDGTLYYHPISTDRLKSAAIASIQLPLDCQSGRRPGDPLDALVTYANVEEWAPVADTIVGRHIPGDWQGEVMAARVRAAMRRWAERVGRFA